MLDFAQSLGDTVKKTRIEQGLTQVNVAERVAIDSRTIINTMATPKWKCFSR